MYRNSELMYIPTQSARHKSKKNRDIRDFLLNLCEICGGMTKVVDA